MSHGKISSDKAELQSTIYIPSCRGTLGRECFEFIEHFGDVRLWDGSKIQSYSWMINQIIQECPTEVVIICHDRARPHSGHLRMLWDILDRGFGFVGLYCFGFYGFRKDLIRKIGFLDERFIKGGWEDCDFLRRCKEADVAYWESKTVPYLNTVTTEFYGSRAFLAELHFKAKWEEYGDVICRLLPEQSYGYDIGEYQGSEFLPWSESELCPQSVGMKHHKMTSRV